MHNASKMLLKMVMSVVYMITIGLIVFYEENIGYRFLWVLLAGIAVMMVELMLFTERENNAAENARLVWKKFIMVVLKAAVVSTSLVGFLVAFTTGQADFITVQGNLWIINTNYLIVYAITWLILIIITNIVVVA